jgi:hypothetical protein
VSSVCCAFSACSGYSDSDQMIQRVQSCDFVSGVSNQVWTKLQWHSDSEGNRRNFLCMHCLQQTHYCKRICINTRRALMQGNNTRRALMQGINTRRALIQGFLSMHCLQHSTTELKVAYMGTSFFCTFCSSRFSCKDFVALLLQHCELMHGSSPKSMAHLKAWLT